MFSAGLRNETQIRRTIAAAAVVLLAVFTAKFIVLFAADRIGPDYEYFYSKLAAYQYWIERNGFLSIPDYLPYICGGIFDFADPTSFYPSFPTVVSLILPFGWVWPATVVVFGAAGFAGGYALARHGLRLSPMAALVCGTVVLFNGFYSTRMAVGHASFHGFMLLPWIAAFCVVKAGAAWLPDRAAIGLTGLLIAYLVHSGGVYQIAPSMIATLVIAAATAEKARDFAMAAGRYFGGATVGFLISAPKIISALHLMSHFPRDYYPLPGFSGVPETLQFLLSTLFFWPSLGFVGEHFVNAKYVFELHEAVYSVSALPLAALALFVAMRVQDWKAGRYGAGLTLATASRCAVLLALLAVPVAINVYEAHWNEFLKKLPVLGQSVNLVRYFAAYIVPLAALTAFMFDRVVLPNSMRGPFLAAALAVPLFGFVSADLNEFTRKGYDPANIVNALQEKKGQLRRPVTAVAAFREGGEIISPMGRNDLMVQGLSQLACYQPLFGYQLEKFPKHNLHLGPATDITDEGTYNFRNPSCYVFPAYNKCRPGDNFRKGQESDLAVFLDYGPLRYVEPPYLATARVLAYLVLFLALMVVLAPLVWRSGRRSLR